MTDLEITRLCAEALGIRVRLWGDTPASKCWVYGATVTYAPLHDDAQCMALVKKFRLQIDPHDDRWNVALPDITGALEEDLNRAVCKCVAQTQQERQK